MAKIPAMIPVSDLRQHAAGILKSVQQAKEPLIITQRGRAAAVMLSIDEFERVEHERQLLRLLARGEKEIAENEGYDLETVLAEADAILGDDES
jgi:prevent-host-death family protein